MGYINFLTFVFIILKLTEQITWSWFWVVSPSWMILIMVGFALLVKFILDR
jgi:hypothetical protein